MPKWLKEFMPSTVMIGVFSLLMGTMFALSGHSFARGMKIALIGLPTLVGCILAGLFAGHHFDERLGHDAAFKILGVLLGLSLFSMVGTILFKFL